MRIPVPHPWRLNSESPGTVKKSWTHRNLDIYLQQLSGLPSTIFIENQDDLNEILGLGLGLEEAQDGLEYDDGEQISKLKKLCIGRIGQTSRYLWIVKRLFKAEVANLGLWKWCAEGNLYMFERNDWLQSSLLSDITVIDLNLPYWKFYPMEMGKADYFKNVLQYLAYTVFLLVLIIS